MNLTNKQAKEIYQQFNSEKIISGIKEPNLQIKFIKSYIWIFPLFILLGFILNFGILQILSETERIMAYIVAIIVAILSVLGFLSQFYKLYFDDNNLILENKLNKRIVIDINRYPRIYIRHQVYDSYNHTTEMYETRHRYDLHIEQDNDDIVLDIRTIGSNKIALFLKSIETKERQDINESQWQDSSSEKEKTFSNYMTFLSKQEKIIGVKDSSQKMRINNDSNIKKRFKICTILVIVAFILDYVVNFVFHVSDASIFKNFFMGIGCFLGVFDFFFLVMLIDKGKDKSLKISYPSNESIKINKYLLNYKKNNIMIGIRAIQIPTSFEKYNYMLIIRGENNSYSIELTLQHEKQLGEFIDNLIFEPKKL